MDLNLIDEVKNYITPEVISKAGSVLGENPANIEKAVSGALPALLSGLIGKASQPDGANAIMNMISAGNFNGSLLQNISGLFSPDTQGTTLMNAGSSALSGLFGDKVPGVVNAISGFSGIKTSSASSLLSRLGALIMGVLGNKVKTEGLNASGLASYLSSQKSQVAAMMPAGLTAGVNSLGLGNLAGLSRAAGSTATSRADETKVRSNKWVPFILLLAAVALIFYFWKGCGNKTSNTVMMDTTKKTADTPMNAYPSATGPDTSKPITSEVTMKKLPDGTAITIRTNGFEDRLIAFIEDPNKPVDKTTWFTTDGITFETGSASLKPESDMQITHIAEIMKAYPKVNLKIGGYTDNTGDEKANMKLSGDRAKATMNAVVSKGIDANRVAAEGYGSQFPVGDNSTAEGRAKNRRIDVRVTQK